MAEELNESKHNLTVRGLNQTSKYADTAALSARFADSIEEVIEARGEVTVVVKRAGLLPVMKFLRQEPSLQFNFLSDVSGVDLGEFAEPRFAVAYHLYSLSHNHRLRIKVFLPEDEAWVPTVSEVWHAADWMEREIYDMFGVDFTNHPDLRRILMPADYEGYPLRKDFPTKGY
jgi:NADH-quinone oxidoreductase subunit C